MIIEQMKDMTMDLRKQKSPLGPVMQFHLAEIAKIGKSNGNRETTEDEAIQYVKKTVQKLSENQYGNKEEAEILEKLLPRMATVDDVRSFIFHLEATEGLDISNKGSVMKAVKQEFGPLVDMKMVASMF